MNLLGEVLQFDCTGMRKIRSGALIGELGTYFCSALMRVCKPTRETLAETDGSGNPQTIERDKDQR